jgi:hypothetical protein
MLWLIFKNHLLGELLSEVFSFLSFKPFFHLAQAENGGTIDRVVVIFGVEWSDREPVNCFQLKFTPVAGF